MVDTNDKLETKAYALAIASTLITFNHKIAAVKAIRFDIDLISEKVWMTIYVLFFRKVMDFSVSFYQVKSCKGKNLTS